MKKQVKQPKLYPALRRMLRTYDVSYDDLAQYLYKLKAREVSWQYVNNRMNGHKEWELAECYFILDLFEISHDKLHIYFPPDGIGEGEDSRPPTLAAI